MTDFKSYLVEQNLKSNTINNHLNNFIKLSNIYGTDIDKFNDTELANTLANLNVSKSQKLTLGNTLSRYLKYLNKPNDKIVSLIHKTNHSLRKDYELRNKQTTFDYNRRKLLTELNNFYKTKMFKKFIVSFLIIKYNVRNADVNLTIVNHQKKANDKENFLIIRKNNVLYIRNDYKTKSTYGTIKCEIKDKRFYDAVNIFYNDNNDNTDAVKLFDTFKNGTNMVRQQLPFELKQSTIVKIILKEQNLLTKASKISKKRGTSLEVLEDAYNVNK